MSKDKKKGRISRIRNNLKYENNDPLWKKLFYIKENLKQYKGVVIAVILTILLIIICILFVTLSKNRIKNNDILTLYVTDSNGNTKSYDLSLLGHKQFEKLIEDLRIVGDKSESITLKAE